MQNKFSSLYFSSIPVLFLPFDICFDFFELLRCFKIRNYYWRSNHKNIRICPYFWFKSFSEVDYTSSRGWLQVPRLITRSAVDFTWKPRSLYGDVRCNYNQPCRKVVDRDKWFHIPGILNPSDLPTRTVEDFVSLFSGVWFSGPSFLSDETIDYDKKPQNLTTEAREELKSSTNEHSNVFTVTEQNTLGLNKIVDISRYSTLTKLINVVAYILRFKKKLLDKIRGANINSTQTATLNWMLKKGKQLWTFLSVTNNDRWLKQQNSRRPNLIWMLSKMKMESGDWRADLENLQWQMTRRSPSSSKVETGWQHCWFEMHIRMFYTLESRRHWRRYENGTGSSEDETL